MLSIRAWYDRNAKWPLIGLLFTVLLVQVVYFGFVLNENERVFREQIDNLVRVTSVALIQKNRVMIESIAVMVSENPNFREFYVCEADSPIVSFPTGAKSCEHQNAFMGKVIKTPIPGFKGFEIVSVTPYLKLPTGYAFVGVLTILISIFSVILTLFVSRRFEREILAPVLSDFDGYFGGDIVEFAHLRARRNRIIELEKERGVAELAKQVAHDIRSPASALKIFATRKRAKFNEEELGFLSSAIDRIVGISDHLLDRARADKSLASFRSLYTSLEKIRDEKLISNPDAQIEIDCHGEEDSAQVSLGLTDWERIVSNLVQNSIEASDFPLIRLTLKISPGFVSFACRDNGRGMSPEILEKVSSGGGTFGKTKGNGLGLAHLMQVIQSAQGKWNIQSADGEGTTINIEMPVAT